jgi:hypothetical protein
MTGIVNIPAQTLTASPSRLVPVPKWNQHHEWPSVAGLRWMIFHAKSNGFDQVIKRVGRRVLIDEAAFFKWVDTQNTSAHNG